MPVWFYYAKPSDRTDERQEYLATFKQIRPGLLQLDWMSNALPDQYQGCGITRALVPRVAEKHGARVRSSRNRPHEGETHTTAARKVWLSLLNDNLACYDAAEERFYHPDVPPGAA